MTAAIECVAAAVRIGEWTSYGDISAAVHGDKRWARAVGRMAARSDDFPNPHRVLGHRGEVVRGRGRDQVRSRKRLEEEGVAFRGGRADPGARVHWDELARRIGRDPAFGRRS